MSDESDKITQYENDISLTNQIVNGDEISDVAVESGLCPTFRKTMKGITDAGNGAVALAQAAATTATSEADRAQAAADLAESIVEVGPASETNAGLIEIATDSETLTGTDDLRAITPFKLQTVLDSFKPDTPSLSGGSSVDEGDDLILNIDNYDANQTYVFSAEDGNLTQSGASLIYTAPSVASNTSFDINLHVTVDSDKPPIAQVRSDSVVYPVNVIEVPVQDGPTLVFNDSTGWDVTPDAEGLQPPAYSVGVNNTEQIVSGTMEITQVSGQLTVEVGTTATSLVTTEAVVEGDTLVTDQGLVTAGTVSGTGPYTTNITTGGFSVAPTVAYIYNNITMALGAGVTDEYLAPAVSLIFKSSTVESTSTLNTEFAFSDGSLILDTSNEITGVSSITGVGYKTDQPADELEMWLVEKVDSTNYIPRKNFGGFTHTGDGTFQYVTNPTSIDPSKTYLVGVAKSSTATNNIRTSDDISGYQLPYSNIVIDQSATFSPDVRHPVTGYKLSVQQTTSTLIFNSDDPVSDKIYVSGGIHNNIYIDDVSHNVGSVVETGTGPYEVTVTLETPLGSAPTGGENVEVPNRCVLSPTSLTPVIDGTSLKITADKITLTDDPNIKRLAMAVTAPTGLRFLTGKIYTEEKP